MREVIMNSIVIPARIGFSHLFAARDLFVFFSDPSHDDSGGSHHRSNTGVAEWIVCTG